MLTLCPLTIILNSNSKGRVTVLLDGESILNIKHAILRDSRKKFRQSDFSRVFLHGGQELQHGEALPASVRTVFVSAGEEYIPPPADTRIIGTRSIKLDKAVEQLEDVSNLAGVREAVGFADLHPGVRFPIECAIAADDIYPALIGSDIGCGIAVYALAPPSRGRPQAGELANLLQGLDGPWEGDAQAWLDSHGIYRRSPFDQSCLGTIGGGNHFADICLAHSVIDRDSADDIGILKGALCLVVHTGSRGLGAPIQAAHIGEDFALSFPTSSSLLDSYLGDHDYAVRTDDHMELTKPMDMMHNSIAKSSVKLSHSNVLFDMWIYRKGAAPSDRGFIPCSGSKGDFVMKL